MPERTFLDVPRLRLLSEVSSQGSIAAAARVVGITSSAVSQQLSLLEREAGVPLLDRSTRGADLTGAGEALVVRARMVFSLLEEARAELDQFKGELAGQVSIGSIASAIVSIVLPASSRLRQAHPDIELAVRALEPSSSIDELVNGHINLAIIDLYDHVPMALPEYLVATEIVAEPLVLVSPVGFQRGNDLALADLKDEKWVMPPTSAACGQAFRHACRDQGFEPDISVETDDLLLLVESVAQGQGLALLPRLAVASGVTPVSLQALAGPRLQRRILTVTRSSNERRPIIRAVLDELRRPLAQQTAVL